MTEREHGSRDLREPLDIVARAEAAVRGAIDEAARAVCAEASAKEAVRLMTEAETQTALAEALVLRVVARKHLLLEYPCLNAIEPRG